MALEDKVKEIIVEQLGEIAAIHVAVDDVVQTADKLITMAS